jgi:3-methylfumaryl-CoA hydratase
MTQDLERMKDWIGRKEVVEDHVTVYQIQGLRCIMDDGRVPVRGEDVGPMDHWCFFYPKVPASEVGPDGHFKRGGFLPPVPLPRRMFGGCRTTYHQPMRVGEDIRMEKTIKDVVVKQGRSGTLLICTILHEMSGEKGLCITEEHDVVYREDAPADAPTPGGRTNPAPSDHAWIREITPDPVMLFRYSAVSFVGHRIHYDRKYTMEVEGYPGLVVHGPLTAHLMLNLGLDNNPGRKLTGYTFQARAPLFDTAPFKVAGKPNEDGKSISLWSVTPEGTIGTLATATFAE